MWKVWQNNKAEFPLADYSFRSGFSTAPWESLRGRFRVLDHEFSECICIFRVHYCVKGKVVPVWQNIRTSGWCSIYHIDKTHGVPNMFQFDPIPKWNRHRDDCFGCRFLAWQTMCWAKPFEAQYLHFWQQLWHPARDWQKGKKRMMFISSCLAFCVTGCSGAGVLKRCFVLNSLSRTFSSWECLIIF